MRTLIAQDRSTSDRAVAVWLFACAAAVFVMVVIGGVTRLTNSGLSITQWNPLIGALPPMTDAAWQHLYDLYRQTPEYQKVNLGMTLAEFKGIFWWEWTHRNWGRLIGVLFAAGLVWFWIRGRLDRFLVRRLAVLLGLGALQGGVGWWMVASGLVDRPDVSQYRLAIHLMMALLIYAGILWVALDLATGRSHAAAHPLARLGWVAIAAVVLTIASGAFVAGTDAGLIYNSFPNMGPGLVPPDYRDPQFPLWLNAFEHPPAIQLHHRILAVATVCWLLVVAVRVMVSDAGPRARLIAAGLGGMALVQLGLGIATLLLVVPLPLAALHQAGAVALLTLAIATTFVLRRAGERPAIGFASLSPSYKAP